MKLTLFSPTSFTTVTLPRKCAGQYWMYDNRALGNSVNIIAVDGIRPTASNPVGEWVLKSNACFQVIDRHHEIIPSITLEPMNIYRIQSPDGRSKYLLYTEPLSSDRKEYQAYHITVSKLALDIGRDPSCAIQYANSYIGKNHATLLISNGEFMITDNNSLNGTFVNGRAVQQAVLKYGDVIYMMGMQIIVTKRFLYINNPDNKVNIHTTHLQEYHAPPFHVESGSTDSNTDPLDFDDYYYRAPRFKHDVEPFELKLDPPPAGQSADTTPMIMSIGPSITMGMASATTAAYSVVNALSSGNVSSAIPSLVMSLGMLSGTLLWPTLTKSYQRKALAKREEMRYSSYNIYLDKMEQRINQEIFEQEQILRNNDLSTSDYLARFVSKPLQIWERTPKHTDFLRLRLGCGCLPLNGKIQYPERRFSVEQDILTEAMLGFGEKERWLNDVPICLSLRDRFISGIYSDHAQLLHYAKNLILQLITLHSYDEVKLVVLYDQKDADALSFVRWLPHTMDNDRRVRYIATTSEEAKTLSADLEPIIEHRKSLNPEQMEDELPYFVVLCLDKKLTARSEFVKTILKSKEYLHFSVISMYERLKDLPNECSAVIELDRFSNGSLTFLNDISDPPIPFNTDISQNIDIKNVTEVIANTLLDLGNSSFQLPSKYTFLEMMDIGMVDHINLLENWASNDPTRSLAAPIGIDTYGDPLYLDIHERAHGPHGLIAGMTGSGKSETIISYILSLAINYHPNDVAFILIDYKGGGMAKAFENLPHTAGIITNLDGNAINRSLVSMQSELHRRELIFQKVSKQHNISNIDIYKYQKLYREGKVSDPLPHLVIVSDEFAELKKDQPDFMDALTSTARVGRSLGVHLILATQKPGGVVDDQIRSNSRFRLCLKVQDRGDSTEMMNRPDAASLVETGRFYLQVGNNEVFEKGQSAWAGAPYIPSPFVIKDRNDALQLINTNGHVLSEVNTNRHPGSKDAPKQLDAITDYIRKVSEDEQISRWKMWLDPIPQNIYVHNLEEKYTSSNSPFVLAPIVGEYDDPFHQTQGILRVPISEEGNVIVYGSTGSGKGMFLESMCYSLIREHTPEQVNMYILDFGSEAMTAFSDAPHVGDIILSHESEKVDNLFKLMYGKLASRKKLLSGFGSSLAQYNTQAAQSEPNIVVFINNYANFSELFEGRVGDINYLTREGIRYGIYFVLSCTGINNVRFSMLQNFKNIYCLQMNNAADYATIIGKTGGLVPDKSVGRGIVRLNKDSVLEFQTARITDSDNPYQFLRSYCSGLARKYHGSKAISVPVLPEVVSLNFLSRFVDSDNLRSIPIGVEKETLDIARFDFTAHPIQLVLAQNCEWKNFTASLATLLADKFGVKTIMFAPSGISDHVAASSKLQLCIDCASASNAAHDIFQKTLERFKANKHAISEHLPAPDFEPLFVVIQSMSQLKSMMENCPATTSEYSDDSPFNRLTTAMEKCAANYGIYFIVAENLQTLSPFSAEAWYKTNLNLNNGLWIGDGISSQYRLNVTLKPQGYTASLEDSFGWMIQNSKATMVKFLE